MRKKQFIGGRAGSEEGIPPGWFRLQFPPGSPAGTGYDTTRPDG